MYMYIENIYIYIDAASSSDFEVSGWVLMYDWLYLCDFDRSENIWQKLPWFTSGVSSHRTKLSSRTPLESRCLYWLNWIETFYVSSTFRRTDPFHSLRIVMPLTLGQFCIVVYLHRPDWVWDCTVVMESCYIRCATENYKPLVASAASLMVCNTLPNDTLSDSGNE